MHYVHLGHVGLIANFHWAQILDFALGWTTLDIEGDDGKVHVPSLPARVEPAK